MKKKKMGRLMADKVLLDAVKMAYRKHHKDDLSIGWRELSDILFNALTETMGDKKFLRGNERLDNPNQRGSRMERINEDR